ncbi:MAG TPA: hypothetical protein VGE47_15735 [Burkholderiaceae bacterium]
MSEVVPKGVAPCCQPAAASSRWFLLMANLLYPALLGTLIYNATAEGNVPWVKDWHRFSWLDLLRLCVLAHFCVDYVYTVVSERGRQYDFFSSFLPDFLILICLWWAARSINATLNPPLLNASWSTANPLLWLCLGKLLAVAWELKLRWPVKRGLQNDSPFWSDACAAFAYIATFMIADKQMHAFWLIVLLTLDSLSYWWEDCKRQQTARAIVRSAD